MRAAAFATLAFAALAAAEPVPAGVSSAIAPHQSPPPGCSPNYDGTFLIYPVNVSLSGKRDLESRNTQLGITLKNGILTDPQGRTGYIAANSQFQFDDPPQAGAIWTAGFSVCQNKRLALGSDDIWYKCLSGDFFNLYFKNVLGAGQCIQSYILTRPLNGGHPGSVPASLSTLSYSSSFLPANFSATHTTSSSGAPSNNTASVSSGAVSSSSGATVGPTTKHTGGGPGHTGPGGHTTGKATQTTGGGGSSPSSAAASSSSGGAAVAVGGNRGEMFGLAAGLLAIAMF